MILDIAIFAIYVVLVFLVGLYFYRKNKTSDDYYVAGRNVSSWHIGLSVVATDVGGGFSIGLGGLGFTMGLSGSWLLFTGLIGAWMAAVLLIPKVYQLPGIQKMTTLPQIFEHFYGKQVAILAGIITTVGYLGFTSSQIIAGAKLATGTFEGFSFEHAVLLMGVVAVGYTILGGLKAVIYTDTVQWIILMAGLLFAGIPFAYDAIGGWPAVNAIVNKDYLTLTNLTWKDLVNWAVTIIPIWFVGMTLYQRIFASRGEKQAKKAWFIAGLFEWPLMAFLGVILGLFGRVAYEQGIFEVVGYAANMDMDPELGLPVLLRTVLPHGLMGLVLAAYFSAVMSTADSCLMASSGSFLTDILRFKDKGLEELDKKSLRSSQGATLVLGVIALIIALSLENVLEAMLFSYAFMVSGLFVPIIGAFYWKKATKLGAFVAMLLGGLVTTTLTLMEIQWFGLDPNLYGIISAAIVFISIGLVKNNIDK
ncbi:sodium:solute symporter family protein [Ekhidna sp. MALMAid0563]|uniref:sodium:solute symporter family protein n=1 Tax=Ekhidna sp. MALMAid0563 TaxID=3143937 RepID=UPI0032DFCABE